MKPNTTRQTEYHNKMIEAGFKKRSFYISDDNLDKLKQYMTEHDLKNLHEALNDLLTR